MYKVNIFLASWALFHNQKLAANLPVPRYTAVFPPVLSGNRHTGKMRIQNIFLYTYLSSWEVFCPSLQWQSLFQMAVFWLEFQATWV